jgi:hypothetical protein
VSKEEERGRGHEYRVAGIITSKEEDIPALTNSSSRSAMTPE